MAALRSFSTLGCPELSLPAVLDLATRNDLDGVEIRALGGTIDLPRYFRTEFGTPDRLAAYVHRSPARIFAFGTSLKLIGAKPGDQENFLDLLPWVEAAGVPRLRVFDGGLTADDAEIAEAVRSLDWWADLKRRHGWKTELMIETHDSLFTSASINRLLAVAPGASILWDSHHTWRKGGENPAATWAAIRERVVHVHIKDSLNVPKGRHPYTYVLPGQGDFPARDLLGALRRGRYGGPLSLEWERMWHPELAPLEVALKAAATAGWW